MTSRQKAGILLAVAALTFVIGAAVWMTWKYYTAMKSLMQPENMANFRERLSAFGIWGAAALFGIQAFQAISGIIPALPIQVCAGITYGTLGGLLLCMAGILAGSSLVFVSVKKFGQPLVDRFFPLHKQRKLRFLRDHSRLNRIVFLLYLLPAMPKDVLTYLAALTPLTLRRYLLLTMTARIPSVLCATFASDAIMEGNYISAVVVFCISGALGILCMSFSRQIIAWMKQLKKH